MKDTNSCDKCGKIEYSDHLIWLTAEDFMPLKGEIVPPEAYNNYDALCEPCYLKEIEK